MLGWGMEHSRSASKGGSAGFADGLDTGVRKERIKEDTKVWALSSARMELPLSSMGWVSGEQGNRKSCLV